MTPDTLDVIAHAIALPVAILMLIYGLDDLFIDLSYYLRGMRSVPGQRLSADELRAKPKRRIAMMVPAWHEADVIDRMLDLAMSTLEYDPDCFDIFVGTYPNDPETRAKVALVTARNPHVHECVVPHDGPTSKADCLNSVWGCILAEEAKRDIRFEILVMHDSEDVIHPLALLHYNWWIPEHDFVQTPVLPLEPPLYQLVGGTYIDEFTEHHLKDMIVRGQIGGLVPSAGVGSAFAREAFEATASGHHGNMFDVNSLTEDYEVGLKLRLSGRSTYFACDVVEDEKLIDGKSVRTAEIVATREYFPTNFWASIRQRSRWICGIVFQTWEKVGWRGSLPVLYTLYRDRRAVFCHMVVLAAYAVVTYCVARYVYGEYVGHPWHWDHLFVPGSVLAWLVIVNTILCTWRAVMKVGTLKRAYGWRHSLLSILRFPVANVISFLATVSAAKQYAIHKVTGRPLRWKKTDHVFPEGSPFGPPKVAAPLPPPMAGEPAPLAEAPALAAPAR